MEFEKTVGKVFGFYGVDVNAFKLGGSVFEAMENADDGYRSMLDTVSTKTDPSGCIFFKRALAKVRVEVVDEANYFSGYRLVDVADGHVWLRLGTNLMDDYYPCFAFEYQPKKP